MIQKRRRFVSFRYEGDEDERSTLARPGNLLMAGSTLVSHLALFFSFLQNPQGFVGNSILSRLRVSVWKRVGELIVVNRGFDGCCAMRDGK